MFFDLFIIISAFSEFGFFWLLHILFFRYIKHEEDLKWLIYLYLSTNLIGGVFIIWFFKIAAGGINYSFNTVLFIMVSIFTIFSLLVENYVVEIFGLLESSIQIKLLSLIAKTKTKEITQKNITRIYNKEVIINKRLLRLISSGDLIFYKGKYYPGKRFSVFYLMAKFSKFIDFLYR